MASDVDTISIEMNTVNFSNDSLNLNGSMDDFYDDDRKQENQSEIYFLAAMLTVFAVVGAFGNLFVLYGFSKMLRQNLTSTVFILTLAGTDLLTCVIIIPYTIYMEFVQYMDQPDVVCKMYHFLITSTVPYSIFMMSAIAVDRYLCICRPFLHIMNLTRAKIVVIVLALWAILLGLIISLFYGVYERVAKSSPVPYNNTISDMNATESNASYTDVKIIEKRRECDKNDLIFSIEFQSVVQYIQFSLFVIAVIIVAVLYGCIFKAVTKRRRKTQKIRSTNSIHQCNGNASRRESVFTQLTQRKRRSSTQESTKRNSRRSERAFVANLRTALTLFIVAVVFIVVFLPAWMMALRIVGFNLFVFYLHLLHNVINPFIYAFMNETFRRVLRKLFSCTPAPAHKAVMGGMSQTTC